MLDLSCGCFSYEQFPSGSAEVTVTYAAGPAGTAITTAPAPTAGQVEQLSATTTSGLPVQSWAWDFGGYGTSGSSGPEASVEHVYATRGTYRASVTVTDAAGDTDAGKLDVHVYGPLTAVLDVPGDTGGTRHAGAGGRVGQHDRCLGHDHRLRLELR